MRLQCKYRLIYSVEADSVEHGVCHSRCSIAWLTDTRAMNAVNTHTRLAPGGMEYDWNTIVTINARCNNNTAKTGDAGEPVSDATESTHDLFIDVK